MKLTKQIYDLARESIEATFAEHVADGERWQSPEQVYAVWRTLANHHPKGGRLICRCGKRLALLDIDLAGDGFCPWWPRVMAREAGGSRPVVAVARSLEPTPGVPRDVAVGRSYSEGWCAACDRRWKVRSETLAQQLALSLDARRTDVRLDPTP